MPNIQRKMQNMYLKNVPFYLSGFFAIHQMMNNCYTKIIASRIQIYKRAFGSGLFWLLTYAPKFVFNQATVDQFDVSKLMSVRNTGLLGYQDCNFTSAITLLLRHYYSCTPRLSWYCGCLRASEAALRPLRPRRLYSKKKRPTLVL